MFRSQDESESRVLAYSNAPWIGKILSLVIILKSITFPGLALVMIKFQVLYFAELFYKDNIVSLSSETTRSGEDYY